MKNFEDFVDYGYTREMENNLDNVACGIMPKQLAEECDNIITNSIKNVVEKEKKRDGSLDILN